MTAEGADAAGAGRFTLDTRLSGALGGRTAQAIERAFGYRTVGELLAHYPRRYALRGELTALASLPLDENVTIVAEVLEVRERSMRSRRGSILEAKISDGTGILTLTFFNQKWRANELRPGVRGMFAGKVSAYRGARQLAHPQYQLFDDAQPDTGVDAAAVRWATAPIPIYPATATLSTSPVGPPACGHGSPRSDQVAPSSVDTYSVEVASCAPPAGWPVTSRYAS